RGDGRVGAAVRPRGARHDHRVDRGPGRVRAGIRRGGGAPAGPAGGGGEGVKSVAAVAAGLPAEAWQAFKVREGACGPLVFQFAAVRVWAMRDQKPGPPVWLLVRRSLEATPEVKYYISNGDAETPLKVLALVACT